MCETITTLTKREKLNFSYQRRLIFYESITGFAITLCGAILFNMGIVEKLWVLATLITLVGFSSGLLNTSGNVFLLHLWKKKGESAKSNSVLQVKL